MLSQGFDFFVESSYEAPIVILRDTVTSQSLVLVSVLPFGCQPDTGMSVLLQGVELYVLNVPLHEVFLKSNLITGPVVVRVWLSLPMRKVSFTLGNDLAGGKVVGSAHVSSIPFCGSEVKSVQRYPELFTAYAITQAISRSAQCPADIDSPVERKDILVYYLRGWLIHYSMMTIRVLLPIPQSLFWKIPYINQRLKEKRQMDVHRCSREHP